MQYTVNGDVYDTEESKRLYYLKSGNLEFTCYRAKSGQHFIAGPKVPFPMAGKIYS